MILETGYVYHIKNEYFDFAKDEKLMKNHENGSTRPTYIRWIKLIFTKNVVLFPYFLYNKLGG